jgi:histidinol phosphatase-like enzyme
MILRALSELDIDKNRSFLIGDKESDIVAARGAGIPGFLFTAGKLNEFLDRCLVVVAKRASSDHARPERTCGALAPCRQICNGEQR